MRARSLTGKGTVPFRSCVSPQSIRRSPLPRNRAVAAIPNAVPRSVLSRQRARKRREDVMSKRQGVILSMLLVSAVAVSLTWGAAKPALSVSWSPTSTVAGSSNNLVTVSFVAKEPKDGLVTLKVPGSPSGTPWSAPQTANPAGAGFVSVRSLGCLTAALTGIAPDGTITMNIKCTPRKGFAVDYRATAATLAGPYTFATSDRIGRAFVPTSVQPVVAVGAGPTTSLRLDGLDAPAVAGATQAPTITTLDQYGNVATDYRGTVHFSLTTPTGPNPDVFAPSHSGDAPADHTFTQADAGSHAFDGL